MISKPAIHQSHIEMLAKCPKQYEHRYVNGVRVPPGIAVHSGTGVHVAAAADYMAKRDTGELLPLEHIQEMAAEATDKAIEDSGFILTDDDETSEAQAKGAAKDKAVRLATLHHSEVAPKHKPVHVERQFVLNLEGYPIDVRGTIDLETPQGIRDNKTAAKTPSEDIVHSSVQLSAYALASNVLADRPIVSPVSVGLDYLVDLKRGAKYVPLESRRTVVDMQNFLRRVELAHQMIESGIFPPTNPTNWVCSEKWCGYWKDHCEFGRKGRSNV